MKRLLILVILLFSLNVQSQCVQGESATMTPSGPYQPGDIVLVNYTLNNFINLNINWIHAFQVNLGSGWVSVTPTMAPGNPFGSFGQWIWDIQHTFPSGLNFGPGWRFTNFVFPNWGTSSQGPFNLSFTLVVGQTCTPDDLSVSISVYGDCLTGGWNNGACCIDPPYNIYNGVVQNPLILTSNINHY